MIPTSTLHEIIAEQAQLAPDSPLRNERVEQMAREIIELRGALELCRVAAERNMAGYEELLDRVPKETSATIAAWAEETFGPVASNMSIWHRAYSEFDELRRKLDLDDRHPDAAREAADVCIVLDRLVHRLGSDMMTERDRKMAINRARKWKLTGDGHGQHVEEPSPFNCPVASSECLLRRACTNKCGAKDQ